MDHPFAPEDGEEGDVLIDVPRPAGSREQSIEAPRPPAEPNKTFLSKSRISLQDLAGPAAVVRSKTKALGQELLRSTSRSDKVISTCYKKSALKGGGGGGGSC